MPDPQHDPQKGLLGISLDTLPWLAQLVVAAGMTFGVPTLIVAFYLAQSAGYIDNPVADRLEELKGITTAHELSMTLLRDEVQKQTDELKRQDTQRTLRCVMRAATPAERRMCFPQSPHQP